MGKLVERFRQWPNVSGLKRLKGELAGKHRLRTGDYRLPFRVAFEQESTWHKVVRHLKAILP